MDETQSFYTGDGVVDIEITEDGRVIFVVRDEQGEQHDIPMGVLRRRG